MSKFYTTSIIFMLFIAISSAQPVITASEGNPQVGDSYQIATSDLAEGMQGPSGPNVTWDFSTLSTVSTVSVDYVDPATTGYGANFPDANVALGDGTGVWEMGRVDNDSYNRVGIVQSNIAVPYSNPEQYYYWPAAYGDFNFDDFAATWVNTYTFNRTGTVNYDVDAYGDLILPWGTIENVLRFEIVEDYQDEYELYGYPQTIDYSTEIYVWYKEGMHYPVMSSTFISVNGFPNVASSFMTESSVGLLTPPKVYEQVEVFPNPTTSYTTLSVELKETTTVKISVTDILGKEVMAVANEKLIAGEHDFTINLAPFAKGVYLIKSEVGEAINAQRIVLK